MVSSAERFISWETILGRRILGKGRIFYFYLMVCGVEFLNIYLIAVGNISHQALSTFGRLGDAVSIDTLERVIDTSIHTIRPESSVRGTMCSMSSTFFSFNSDWESGVLGRFCVREESQRSHGERGSLCGSMGCGTVPRGRMSLA